LHRDEFGVEGVTDLLQSPLEAGVFTVQLVDHDEARQMVLVAHLPGQLGADLDAAHSVHHDDGGLAHVQGRAHFTLEVGEAGRVKQIDLVIQELNRDDGGRQRDLSTLLLILKVRDCRPVEDFAVPGGGTRRE